MQLQLLTHKTSMTWQHTLASTSTATQLRWSQINQLVPDSLLVKPSSWTTRVRHGLEQSSFSLRHQVLFPLQTQLELSQFIHLMQKTAASSLSWKDRELQWNVQFESVRLVGKQLALTTQLTTTQPRTTTCWHLCQTLQVSVVELGVAKKL